MVCTKCGAGLMDSDQFCPKCGTRVIKERRCPDCGAVLREGTKFCHKCGRMVEASGGGSRAEDMEDIPMDAIERNILSETEAELKADRRRERASGGEGSGRGSSSRSMSGSESPARGTSVRRASGGEGSGRGSGTRSMSGSESPARGTGTRSASGSAGSGRGNGSRSTSGSSRNASGSETSHGSASRNTPVRRKESEPAVRRKTSVPAPPPRGKRSYYRDEDWEDDWDDDDEDWEDDDWDDDDDEGVDLITVMTAALGCVILVVVALVGFNLYKQYAPKNYDKAGTESSEDGRSDEGNEDGQESGDGQSGDDDQSGQEMQSDENAGIGNGDDKNTYKLKIVSNVNVRDQPSTSGTNVLKVAKAGETYACKGSAGDGNWYEIVLEDGSAGYVFTDYVEVEE